MLNTRKYVKYVVYLYFFVWMFHPCSSHSFSYGLRFLPVHPLQTKLRTIISLNVEMDRKNTAKRNMSSAVCASSMYSHFAWKCRLFCLCARGAQNIFCLVSNVFPEEFVLWKAGFLLSKMQQKSRYKMEYIT